MPSNPVRRKKRRKKVAGRNDGPSRRKYWQYGTLEEHKVKALMKHNGLTREQATLLWRSVRKTRTKKAAAPAA